MEKTKLPGSYFLLLGAGLLALMILVVSNNSQVGVKAVNCHDYDTDLSTCATTAGCHVDAIGNTANGSQCSPVGVSNRGPVGNNSGCSSYTTQDSCPNSGCYWGLSGLYVDPNNPEPKACHDGDGPTMKGANGAEDPSSGGSNPDGSCKEGFHIEYRPGAAANCKVCVADCGGNSCGAAGCTANPVSDGGNGTSTSTGTTNRACFIESTADQCPIGDEVTDIPATATTPKRVAC
ncbi:MAG: hypothetical protein AAB649_06165, partial [Patescibacteria group bacterium]